MDKSLCDHSSRVYLAEARADHEKSLCKFELKYE